MMVSQPLQKSNWKSDEEFTGYLYVDTGMICEYIYIMTERSGWGSQMMLEGSNFSSFPSFFFSFLL